MYHDTDSHRSTLAPVEPPAPPIFEIGSAKTSTICAAAFALALTVLNAFFTFGGRPRRNDQHEIAPIPSSAIDDHQYRELTARIDANEKHLTELEEKTKTEFSRRDALKDKEPVANRAQPRTGIPERKPTTPREQFLAATIKRGWASDRDVELTLGGDTIRTDLIEVRADKICRRDDELDLYVTVKNVGMGQVFAPQRHPYNQQMIFPANSRLIDTFLNWSVTKLELGTMELKPGESATVHYSGTIKIESPLYLWTIYLQTNGDHGKAFYIIASPDDFQPVEAK